MKLYISLRLIISLERREENGFETLQNVALTKVWTSSVANN